MSLLLQRGEPRPLPALSGQELLVDTRDPSRCMVKGVMFLSRERFLREELGAAAVRALLGKLSSQTRSYAAMPLAGSWCEFASLVEYDRAIYEEFHGQYPHILALVGAASAEYGIGKIYRALDDVELVGFLQGIARFHEQYQRYGRVSFTRTSRGGQMAYHDYPCYSPVFCASGFGFFLEAILRHGGKEPRVTEPQCHCRGDRVCLYELEWS
jgi:hypothetical protein